MMHLPEMATNRTVNLSRTLLVTGIAICLYYVGPELAQAQSNQAVLAKASDTGIQTRVDEIFSRYAKPNSPGCAVGVIQNGDFVYRRGFGMGSLEFGIPLTSESVFYMGSVSKQFTAASVVLAAEQGLLSLDDGIRKYIPELPAFWQPVTLRQMLHHTSGVPDVPSMLEGVAGRNLEDLHTTAELMDLVLRQKALNFRPGEQYLYSNANYFLLAEVLKRAAKRPLSNFAAENIFRPLGMTHSRFYDDHSLVVPGRVAAYRQANNGDFLVDWSTNYDTDAGAGGLMSTVDDLLLWDRNFYRNRLGKGTLLKELQARGQLNNGEESDYALGLVLGTYRGLPIVEHGGGAFGYRTEIIRFPQQRFTVITLCNLPTDPASLSRKVVDVYLEKDLRPPSHFAADPAPFAGTYFDSRTHYLTAFAVSQGHLVLEGHALQAIAATAFEDPIIPGGTVTFSKAKGVMKATVTYNHAITFAGTRIDLLHLDNAALGAYVGTYKSDELDAIYKLTVENGNLVLRMNWKPEIKLQAVVPGEFNGGGIGLSFHTDARNRVSGLTVFSGWDGAIRNENFDKLK